MPGKRENPESMPDKDDDLDLNIERIFGDYKEEDESDEEDDEGDENEEDVLYALAMLEAEEDRMLLPREAFFLYTEVTDVNPSTNEIREGTLVVHNDRENEALYALCFESLDAATDMKDVFESATGEEAVIRRFPVMSNLADHFRIRFYHANGIMEDLTQNQYRERCL
jgi:hypothetical protein